MKIKPINKSGALSKSMLQQKTRKDKKDNVLKITGSIIILILAVLFCFSKSFQAKFTDWDDTDYVLENSLVQNLSADNFGKMFTGSSATNYHPLTILSLAIDYKRAAINPQTKEPDPFPFHQTNIFLHLFNVLLMFAFIYYFSNKKWEVALIVAFLFGVHPMHVESVSWISGRKDLLYSFFFLGSLLSYWHYNRKKSTVLYCLSLFLFLLSILSKPAAAPLGLILLLMDYYQSRIDFRFTRTGTYKNLLNAAGRRILLEKIPFLAGGLVIILVTFMIQKPVAIVVYERFTIFQRVLFSSYGFCSYLVKLVWPTGLSAFYPFPNAGSGEALPFIYYFYLVIAIALLAIVLWSETKSRLFTFGIFFYLVMLLLVLQFVTIGQTIISDRYTYLSYTGVFFIIGISYSRLWSGMRELAAIWKYTATAVLAAFMISMLVAGYSRTLVWQNSDNLWSDVLHKFPDSVYPRKTRATHYLKNNRMEEALKDYEKLAGMNSNDPEVFNYIGYIYSSGNNHAKAVPAIKRAIQLDSNNAEYYYNCALSLSRLSQFEEAIRYYSHAILKNPKYDAAHLNRGLLYGDAQETDKAIADFDYLVMAHPESDEYLMQLGFLKMTKNLYSEAITDLEKGLRINSANPRLKWFTGICYFYLKDFSNAVKNMESAARLGFCPDRDLYNHVMHIGSLQGNH